MQVNVLALEGVFDTGLSIVLDALTTANELLEMQRSTVPRWNVSVVGVRRRVATAQQMVIPAVRAHECPKPDLVIVPAIGYKMPDALINALDRPCLLYTSDAADE